MNLGSRVKKGDSVAITGGRRGIANIDIITRVIVEGNDTVG